ncbi:cache domain-containing protein [Poseidonibacter lekithochrous]|uniref:cache domain-containing protein n=1 Tax=Poseidonibacter TaxID=2321187 RepID=UPI001C091415|nr:MULTISPECIES: cache domain-containing protein [Poseidonibacter]MBU3015948.1 cache domain-containing protein [Poseidonibacter lekithochrous]MDO6829247.1 cache domain-containing protein [Poseidonibacter sp. 1_MG-2023]
MNKKVNNLLNIIKYTPPIIIVLTCIIVIFIMYEEQERDFKTEKLFVETEYINIEKDTLYSNINTIFNYIKNEKRTTEELLRKDLKSKINNVYQITTNIYLKNKDTYSKDEIIKQIKNAIETIRFNEGRAYFSIHNMNGVNILEPINPQLEGKSLLNIKDNKGNYPMRQIIEVLKTQEESFLDWYHFKENDKSKEFKKIELVRKFEPYNLIISTSIYLDEYEENLKKKILNQISKFQYKNDGYIFLIDFKGNVLLHPSKKARNHNISKEEEFSYMNDYIKDLISKEEKNAGSFISLKPTVTDNKDTKETRVIFSKRFDDWEWVIGTSFKLSDANKIIEKRKLNIEKQYSSYKRDVLLYGFLFTIVLLIVSFFVARLIEKKILSYKKNLEKQIFKNVTQKENLLKAQQIANIGDWKLDLSTYKAYWSNEFIRMFGVENVDKKNFGPEYIKTLIVKEDVHYFENSLNNCIKTGEQHNCIYRINRPDNDIRWINCRAEINKDKTFIMGTVQDITDSKKLELEKEQQSELLYQQSKMASMGEMIGNIAHQWRQPLSTITTASTGARLQKEMNCLSDKELDDTFVTINNSAQYLSQTIDDFRGFFNPKNSILNEFKIENTLTKTLKLIDAQFNVSNIEIIKNIENYELLSIENDLIQVLINILNNAKDALITKDEIRRLIFINTYKKEDALYIEIIDNAGGIEDNIIDRIFEPYFTTKYKSQGTGIGLYMSVEIITKRLNGNIEVRNETYDFDGISYTGAKFIIKI